MKVKIPRTSQQTIPFKEIYSNGIIKVTDTLYCLICSFSNVNYQMSRDEEKTLKFNQYCDVLNTLDPELKFQLYLNNKNIDKKELVEELIPDVERNDGLEEIHEAYKTIQNGFIDQSYSLTAKKENYLVVGIEKAGGFEDVERTLNKTFKDIQKQFKVLDSDVEKLETEEQLKLFYEFYNPEMAKDNGFMLPKDIYSRGVKIKDHIAPNSFKFKTTYAEMGAAYTRTLYIRDLPTLLKDSFISDILDNSFSLRVSIHIESKDPGDAMTFIQRKITSLETGMQERKKNNKKSGMDFIPYHLRTALKESENLLENLTSKDQKMFLVGIYINITANTLEELNDRTKTIQKDCRKHLVVCDVLTHQQEDALASVLPLANNKVGIKRILLTDSTAIFMPFSSQDIFHKGGFYYGRNQVTNSMVVFNRKLLKNSNGFILGIPGSGKSMKAKREIIDVLEKTDDDIIIIDPEREFFNLCKEYNGQNIRISASSKTHLNPMDLNEDYADDDDPIQLKSEFILSICETLKGSLTPTEKTIVDRCVKIAYKSFIENNWNQDFIPTFTDFYNIMLEQTEAESKDIALAIELYVKGSLNTFSDKSNVNLTNRFTVFDTKDLGKQLKKLGLLITLDTIWNRICINRGKGKYTWIVTDEFYLLFDDKEGEESYSANYYYELYKRARKWGGIPTGITQNIEDLLQSKKARTMLSNSQFLVLLDQSASDRAEIAKLLNLSYTQLGYVSNAKQGSGLLISGKDIIPIEDEYPMDNKIYQVITTKPGDDIKA